MREGVVKTIKARLFKDRLVGGAECDAAERVCRAADPSLVYRDADGNEVEHYPDLQKTAEWIVGHAIAAGWRLDEIAASPSSDLIALVTLSQASSRQTDTKTDTQKKPRKMTAAAAGAAKLYRELHAADDTIDLKHAVSEYVEQHSGSVESIYRTLNDNPDQWQIR